MRGERPEGLVFKSVAVVFGVLGDGFPDSRRAAGLRRNVSDNDVPMVAFGGQTLLLSASNSGSHRR